MYINTYFVKTINGDNMKQVIECSVYNCKYCDCSCDLCNLKKIKVANCNTKESKQSTMCDSFKQK